LTTRDILQNSNKYARLRGSLRVFIRFVGFVLRTERVPYLNEMSRDVRTVYVTVRSGFKKEHGGAALGFTNLRLSSAITSRHTGRSGEQPQGAVSGVWTCRDHREPRLPGKFTTQLIEVKMDRVPTMSPFRSPELTTSYRHENVVCAVLEAWETDDNKMALRVS
jgi:hypothetical protein